MEDHEGRSIRILDKCGFTLTNQERNAIITHHNKDGFFYDPLRMRLSLDDMNSADKWLEANDLNYNSSLLNIIKNIGFKIISKL